MIKLPLNLELFFIKLLYVMICGYE